MKKISVLMSLYYKEKPEYLFSCLESIFNQTLLCDEIVLVLDGGITKSLQNILDLWLEKLPLKIVPLPENIGLGKALNEGMKYCSHEWIFRMDTDDICFPNRFEKQITYIEQNPDIDIFSGQVVEFSKNYLEYNSKKQVPLSHPEILKFAKHRCPFNHMAIAYKKSVVETVGGYQHHSMMEDYNLWIRVLAAGYKSANLPENLVYVRAGNAMLERRRGCNYVESEWKLFKLKQNLNFQSLGSAFFIFILRSIPRILPVSVLNLVYKYLRN